MKRIGLTQRVEVVARRGERRDGLDRRWAELLVSRGFAPVPLCNLGNDVRRYLAALDLHGVILTGGNDLASLDGARDAAPERDHFEHELLALCGERALPVLGVCRGAQVMCLFHAGGVSPVADHVARRHAVTREVHAVASAVERVVRDWPTRFEVNSYHAFTLSPDRVRPQFLALARADDGSVEAMGHVALPQLGILWHPERERPFVQGPLDLVQALFSGAAQR